MRRAFAVGVLMVTLFFGASAPTQACMECDPAFILQNGYGYTCILTVINYDCEICTVTSGACDPFHPHVPTKA
jgi:hypothetical protein